MRRRAFLGFAGATGVMVLRGRAQGQTSAKDPRVVYLGSRAGLETSGRAFVEGLRELGYVSGRNVVLDVRTFDNADVERLGSDAQAAVASSPDVIFASNAFAIAALVKATKSIPIVGVDLQSDPVAQGWAGTLAKPGGNFTGFFLDTPEISGKQLQFLREIRPDLRRVGVLGDARVNELQFAAIESVARSGGLTLHTARLKTADEAVRAIAEAARQRASGLVVLTSPLMYSSLPRVAEAAVAQRLPAISPFAPRFAEAGGLLAYGPDIRDLFRRSAGYVDRVLRGAIPGDLPIQRPEKFLLVVNLKTARAIKVTLPVALVQRSDRVIE